MKFGSAEDGKKKLSGKKKKSSSQIAGREKKLKMEKILGRARAGRAKLFNINRHSIGASLVKKKILGCFSGSLDIL